MKIKKVKIKNFRIFKEETCIDISDFNLFVGENDIGKSTILEALDIFFNEKNAINPLEYADLNVMSRNADGESVEISVVFSNFPEEIDLDGGFKTTLEDEYLLNKYGLLEVKKVYSKHKEPAEVFIVAHHPDNSLCKDLLLKKRNELKKVVDDLGVDCNRNINAEMRKAIREHVDRVEGLKLKTIEIPVNKEDAKIIWEKIRKHMPVYALFQSDRQNTDQDAEAQDPIQAKIESLLQAEEIQKKLEDVANTISEQIKEVAENTLEKLREINPRVANELHINIPEFSSLNWKNVFKKTGIVSDNGIPLNKRGSGVRRLILLNFFRAEAENKEESKTNGIIYAIEEPETALHPDNQKAILNSLVDLSDKSQILLTTHNPAIASLSPIESINFIHRHKKDALVVENGEANRDILRRVSQALGVLPQISKVVVCVEGENDRAFLINLNNNIPELKNIIDLEKSDVSIIPMTGSNLQNWVDRNYLDGANVLEFHLYDNDREEYRRKIEEIKAKKDERGFGVLTKKREMENYIPPSIVEKAPEFKGVDFSQITDWNNTDIPKYIAERTNLFEKDVKQIINRKLSKSVTKEMLEETGDWEEILGWFEMISELVEKTV